MCHGDQLIFLFIKSRIIWCFIECMFTQGCGTASIYYNLCCGQNQLGIFLKICLVH